jgi:hypothetical protein
MYENHCGRSVGISLLNLCIRTFHVHQPNTPVSEIEPWFPEKARAGCSSYSGRGREVLCLVRVGRRRLAITPAEYGEACVSVHPRLLQTCRVPPAEKAGPVPILVCHLELLMGTHLAAAKRERRRT